MRTSKNSHTYDARYFLEAAELKITWNHECKPRPNRHFKHNFSAQPVEWHPSVNYFSKNYLLWLQTIEKKPTQLCHHGLRPNFPLPYFAQLCFVLEEHATPFTSLSLQILAISDTRSIVATLMMSDWFLYTFFFY